MEAVSTHSDTGIKAKMVAFLGARKYLKGLIKDEKIDVAHIHVTHGLSWWRKRYFMSLCIRGGISTIVHIHSGKFDSFCRGIAGFSVKGMLNKPGVKVIILEERWKNKLRKWIPESSIVVPNFSTIKSMKEREDPGERIELLMLSRGSKIKQIEFGLDIVRELRLSGREARLLVTGKKFSIPNDLQENVESLGWISQEEKYALLERVDFLLSPSIYEGCSMSVIEAMNCNLPPIVSEASGETVGISELVEKEFDAKKWSDKIIFFSESKRYQDWISVLINLLMDLLKTKLK